MTDRKFTPPTTFPAYYVDGEGERVIIRGVSEDGKVLIGYWPRYNVAEVWQRDGKYVYNPKCDLHDTPKRVKWYEVRCGAGYVIHSCTDLRSLAAKFLSNKNYYATLYECDEDGGNPTVTPIDPSEY